MLVWFAHVVAAALAYCPPPTQLDRVRAVADATLAANRHEFVNGDFTGTYWTPAPAYIYPFSGDLAMAMEGYPDAFTAAEIQNLVRVFQFWQTPEGDVPIAVGEDGYPTRWNGGPCPRKNYAHTQTDSTFSLPQMEYIAWKKGAPLDPTVLAKMAAALETVPLSPAGLVHIGSVDPWISWGYHDDVLILGDDLWGSLMYRQAALALSEMLKELYSEETVWAARAAQVEKEIGSLRDSDSGMYLAGSEQNDQIDILGSCYAVAHGALSEENATAVSEWVVAHYAEITRDGFIRQSPANWEVTGSTPECPLYSPGNNQDGYWAVGNGWVYETIALTDPGLATQYVEDWLGGLDSTLENHGATQNGHPWNMVSTTGFMRVLTPPPTP